MTTTKPRISKIENASTSSPIRALEEKHRLVRGRARAEEMTRVVADPCLVTRSWKTLYAKLMIT